MLEHSLVEDGNVVQLSMVTRILIHACCDTELNAKRSILRELWVRATSVHRTPEV